MNITQEIRDLVSQLNIWTKAYDEGHPLVSDAEWDMQYFNLLRMEQKTGHILPYSPTQKINYDVVNELKKVKHNHPMLSLAKTKEIEEIERWQGKHNCILMGKMDGLTCSLTYKNGKLISAETRGNGEIGEDILHNAIVIKSIPKKINYEEELTVDGEIICKYSDFEKFKEEYKNPRNFAAGSIRLLDSSETYSRNLTFVAWDIIKDDYETLSDKFEHLDKLGFQVVPHCNYENEKDIDYLKEECLFLSYPIDGMVFKYDSCKEYDAAGRTEHHYSGGMAYKFYDEEVETELISIDWTLGRTGVLTPVAVFQPVEIENTEVSRASLHNISVMEDIMGDCCYSGQKIKVAKMNQIIPQVKSAVKMTYGDVISHGGVTCDGFSNDYGVLCPVCGGGTAIEVSDSGVKNLVCTNPQCEGKRINQLEHFCSRDKGLDIRGLSKKTLEKLIDWKWVNSIEDIFELANHRKEWINKAGFGPTSVDKVLAAIVDSTHTDLWKFISSLGIPLIGRAYSKQLAEYFKTWDKFRNACDDFDFTSIDGFGEEMHYALRNYDFTIADSIVDKYIHFNKIEEKTAAASVEGMKFCITGKLSRRRDDIKADIEAAGGKVTGSVSSKTNYLVCNDKDSNTGKSKDAKALGIPIITEEELKKLLAI